MADTLWKQWSGRSENVPPSDWDGGPCLLGDGTIRQPRGLRSWAPYDGNMVAFYPITNTRATPNADDALRAENERLKEAYNAVRTIAINHLVEHPHREREKEIGKWPNIFYLSDAKDRP